MFEAVTCDIIFSSVNFRRFGPLNRQKTIQNFPAALPAPGLLVSLTGALELTGAIGLLIPRLAWLAALALAALLVALFSANIHAARAGLEIAGRRATKLSLRLPLQLFWIGCLLWVAATSSAVCGLI